VDCYGFEVERKKDKEQSEWEKIGFVEGSGNSNSPKQYSFIDENPVAGNLQYRLKQIDTDGKFTYYGQIAEVNFTLAGVNEKQIPTEYGLSQNYPNPFNPCTNIRFQISEFRFVSLKIYDVLGNEIAVLVNEEKEPGYYSVNFNASNFSSGMYIYKITAGSFTSAKKLMLLK
jgi:hypothetical protein